MSQPLWSPPMKLPNYSLIKTHDPTFASRPKNQATNYIFYGSKGMVFSEYCSYWRSVKKLCTLHLLNASKIESFGPLRMEELKILVKSIERDASMGEIVNVSEKVHEHLEDVVYKMILGRNYKDDNVFDLTGLVKQGMSLAGAFNLADFVPSLGPFDLQGLTRRLKETSEALDQVLEKIMKEHEQAYEGHHHRDFIDILLSLMHQSMDDKQEHGIDRENIKAIALDMILGSYETSAVAIEWAFSELLRNPRVMKNLQHELQTIVGIHKMVQETDLSKLNYLHMVVKETLRLHPVGPFIPRESIEDVMVDGYYIEKKTRILVNLWAIGRNPKIWSDYNVNVDVFYPERVLNSDVDLHGNDFELIPFGSGRRKCPGMQMGLITVKLVLAQLVHRFNWKLPGGMRPCDLDMTETFGLTIPRSKQLLAIPTNRVLI